jgi:hypothetical protein
MNLKKAVLWAMIGISYIFISRTAASFFPAGFAVLWAARVNTVLSLLASLTVPLFYIYFYQEYVREERIFLKNATKLMILGSIAVLILFAKGLLLVFQVIPATTRPGYSEVIVPWVSAVFALIFYAAFLRESICEVRITMRRATYLAIIGAAVSLLIRTLLLGNFVYSGKFVWLWEYSQKELYLFLPVYIFLFFAGVYFLYCFYREQE